MTAELPLPSSSIFLSDTDVIISIGSILSRLVSPIWESSCDAPTAVASLRGSVLVTVVVTWLPVGGAVAMERSTPCCLSLERIPPPPPMLVEVCVGECETVRVGVMADVGEGE